MPAQKRAVTPPSSPSAASDEYSSPMAEEVAAEPSVENPDVGGIDENSPANTNPLPESTQEQDDSDGEGGSTSSQSSGDKEEFILVKLADIRKEVQCPICLGIIRKTRTVMECLHRFCRECIDKSMRLGNKECPACRTHCGSRRSLRDDPNYDALIAALYPDIDKYEEEELAFHEEEKNRNEKIQASIAETFRRQSEALGRKRSTAKATAAAFMRKSQGSYRTGQNSYFRGRVRSNARNTSPLVSDDEDDDAICDDASKDSSSAEEASPERKHKRCRRMAAHRSSPARLACNADLGSEENYDVEVNRENLRTSPLRAGNRELAWGKGGARSQTRHGSTSVSNGRYVKPRLAKLMEYLRNLNENDDMFDVHVKLLPSKEQSLVVHNPYICCPPTLSIKHIREFVAIQTSTNVEEIDIYVRKSRSDALKQIKQAEKGPPEPLEELHKVQADESLTGLLGKFSTTRGDLTTKNFEAWSLISMSAPIHFASAASLFHCGAIHRKRTKEKPEMSRWWKKELSQSLNSAGVASFLKLATRQPQLALPHLSVPDIRWIDWAEVERLGFRGVVFDKDNTLTAPYSLSLWPDLSGSFLRCQAAFGGRVAVFSNSAGLHQYDPDGNEAKALEEAIKGIHVIRHEQKKPSGTAAEIENYFGCPASNLVMVGDRHFTDIVYGNVNGFLTVLTEPLCLSKEPFAVKQKNVN
ncbi:hypothetical protein HPP92_010206 [Vanilla planifolia]|uniref:RING-type domain-containing protein n=1 Tax=Vanilla planifolia TaxID=51239 RepID=A0A835UZH2_VANPL|nr:hypothetical protein HPP92_010206 [Vanilla planifolia]